MSVTDELDPTRVAKPLDVCKFSLVIPVLNEENNLEVLFNEILQVVKLLGGYWEFLFIDDGSTDGSFSVLQKMHAVDKRVRVIRFRKNFGQSAAFAAGFSYARGEYVITMDADGQNDPNDIPKFIETMSSGDFDMVIGFRVARKESILRKMVSCLANMLISRSTGIHIRDRGCSLKLYKSNLVKNIRLYGQMHRFLPEIVSIVGARIIEVPTHDRKRRSGRSKYGAISRTQRVFLDLVTVIFLLGYSNSPMQLFGSVAIFSFLSGVIIAAILAGNKIYQGIVGGWIAFHAYEIGDRPLLTLAILLILLGVQFLMMGLLGEMIMRVYYETREKPTYYIRDILE